MNDEIFRELLYALSVELKTSANRKEIMVHASFPKEISSEVEKWLDENNYGYFIDEKENYNCFSILSNPLVKEVENNEENS